MASFTHFNRLSGFIVGSCRNILHGRTNLLTSSQISNYSSRTSAENKLGIDKPKRPLTPFFKFMTQMRPALVAKNPGISNKEAIAWATKHWQQLDAETKEQMSKDYEKDIEDYKKIKTIYEASLTDSQKADIKRVKEEMSIAREKRKLRAEYKENGRPKKPMSSYFLFCNTKKSLLKGSNIKEFQQQMKKEWATLSESEKLKYNKTATELMKKFKKDLEAWELKMVSIGKTELVTPGLVREKKPKSVKSESK